MRLEARGMRQKIPLNLNVIVNANECSRDRSSVAE